jgi:hypothetical protein
MPETKILSVNDIKVFRYLNMVSSIPIDGIYDETTGISERDIHAIARIPLTTHILRILNFFFLPSISHHQNFLTLKDMQRQYIDIYPISMSS